MINSPVNRHPGARDELQPHTRRDGRDPTSLRITPDTARLNPVGQTPVQLSDKLRRLLSGRSEGL